MLKREYAAGEYAGSMLSTHVAAGKCEELMT
eukprot:CAMPEP_0115834160 /NCGR_PEP_ID=MMETSP0287-20121206/3541_1 /TAXON_ID=412157 /ORGANISM="Chrysochromulina rotalis, Strain UIO044" /LENGTH=30 /DNA_ID= /DNA_START= /DNA_END= /DNA_ORIENTATION=